MKQNKGGSLMDYILTLVFLCANGEKSSISIDSVSPTISSEEVTNIMDIIIEKNVIITKNGILTGKYNAYLTQKQVTKFTIIKF